MEILLNPLFAIFETFFGFWEILVTVANFIPPGLGILIVFGICVFVFNLILDFLT